MHDLFARLPRSPIRGSRGGSVTMASQLLYCRKCHVGYASIGEIPPLCPSCLTPTSWTTTAPFAREPKVPYKLTRDDRIFLKVQAISPD